MEAKRIKNYKRDYQSEYYSLKKEYQKLLIKLRKEQEGNLNLLGHNHFLKGKINVYASLEDKHMEDISQLRTKYNALQVRCRNLRNKLEEQIHERQKLRKKYNEFQADVHHHGRFSLCSICMDREADCCFVPCMHLAACQECALKWFETNRFIRCPVCNVDAEGFEKCFLVG